MRLRRLSAIGWISAVTVFLIFLFFSMAFWTFFNGPAIHETDDDIKVVTKEAMKEQVRTGHSFSSVPSPLPNKQAKLTGKTVDDPHSACEEVEWWKIEYSEEIPQKCLDALDRNYLDRDSGFFAFGGMSFGKSISFHRIFADPVGDRERVLQALQRADCWTTNDYWSEEGRRQRCHSDSFVSYGISLFLCRKIETRKWENSLQFHWVKAKCRDKNQLLDEESYFERLANSRLGSLVEEYYERTNVRPSVNALLLLAIELQDETAIGLSFDDGNLARKYAWKAPLEIMSMIPDWEELGLNEHLDLPIVDHREAIEIALNVAEGLEELGVEPNWYNLVETSRLWVTTDTDTMQDAITELRGTLDPINDKSKLRAIGQMESISIH
ncbi:MAG: hypothetical protein OXG08_02980 [Gammaproteobacteria bacterium]|nr:hypothetical protein [Gammaproteobacteria bacterium]